jgi:hypothetical protein
MNSPHITYTARPDATPEAELVALVNAYSYLIKAHRSKKTTAQTLEPGDLDETAIVTKGGNSVGRDGAATQRRNDATKEPTKESKK